MCVCIYIYRKLYRYIGIYTHTHKLFDLNVRRGIVIL